MSERSASVAGAEARIELARRSVHRSRLLSRAPRHLALATLLVVSAVGLRTIFFPPAPAPGTARPAAVADAPSEDLALRFARAYLTFDATDPAVREEALRPYLPEDLAADGGFDATRGSRRVLWEDIASDQKALAGGRVITVAADVTGTTAPLFMAITIHHETGQPLSVVGYPSLVGAPALTREAPEPPRQTVSERPVAEVVERVLGNYLAGSAQELRADLTPDADVTLPTVPLREQEVKEIDWIGASGSDAVLATVVAAGSGGETYTLTYELGIAWHERPYVDFIEVVPTES
jgi:hypothetical protein